MFNVFKVFDLSLPVFNNKNSGPLIDLAGYCFIKREG